MFLFCDGPNWTPMVPKGLPLGPKGPPWAQRAHLEAEGRPNWGLGAKPPEKEPLGLSGDPSCYPHWGAIGSGGCRHVLLCFGAAADCWATYYRFYQVEVSDV